MKLFKNLSLSVLLISLSTFAIAAPTNLATDAKVEFKGKVIAAACSIDNDSTTGTNAVTLPTVSTGNITSDTTATGVKEFTISVTGCGTSEVQLDLTNFKDDVTTGAAEKNLKNSATATPATGVSIKVEFATMATGATSAPTTYVPIDFTGTNNLNSHVKNGNPNDKLYFRAGYVKTAAASTPTVGNVKAGFSFNLKYH